MLSFGHPLPGLNLDISSRSSFAICYDRLNTSHYDHIEPFVYIGIEGIALLNAPSVSMNAAIAIFLDTTEFEIMTTRLFSARSLDLPISYGY